MYSHYYLYLLTTNQGKMSFCINFNLPFYTLHHTVVVTFQQNFNFPSRSFNSRCSFKESITTLPLIFETIYELWEIYYGFITQKYLKSKLVGKFSGWVVVERINKYDLVRKQTVIHDSWQYFRTGLGIVKK